MEYVCLSVITYLTSFEVAVEYVCLFVCSYYLTSFEVSVEYVCLFVCSYYLTSFEAAVEYVCLFVCSYYLTSFEVAVEYVCLFVCSYYLTSFEAAVEYVCLFVCSYYLTSFEVAVEYVCLFVCSYYLTSFEAAVEYVRSEHMQQSTKALSHIGQVSVQRLRSNSGVDEETRQFFTLVTEGNVQQVRSMLEKAELEKSSLKSRLCHPLCNCRKCSVLLDK